MTIPESVLESAYLEGYSHFSPFQDGEDRYVLAEHMGFWDLMHKDKLPVLAEFIGGLLIREWFEPIEDEL